jgi:hypothetical protein
VQPPPSPPRPPPSIDAGSAPADAGAAALDAGVLPEEALDAGATAERDAAEAAAALAARHRRLGGVEVGRALSLCGNGAPIVRYAEPGVPRGEPIRSCDDFANDMGASVPALTVRAIDGAWVQLSDGDWVLRDALSTAEVLVVGELELLLQGHGNTFTQEGSTLTVRAHADACETEQCGNGEPEEGAAAPPPFTPPPPGLSEQLSVGDAGSAAPQLELRYAAQCCT